MAASLPSHVLGRRAGRGPGRNKYGVSPAAERRHPVTNELFASKAELRRFLDLENLQRAGEISDLRRQVHYPLNVPARWDPVSGIGILPYKVGTYIADHVYKNAAGELVVEDVKGCPTPEYELKKKLMKALHGIDIFEWKPR